MSKHDGFPRLDEGLGQLLQCLKPPSSPDTAAALVGCSAVREGAVSVYPDQARLM
jgi:hypothetical protein